MNDTLVNLKYIAEYLFFYFNSGIRHQELPDRSHRVPDDFIGINIASNDELDTDDYIFDRIHELGIKNLRIYFTYTDFNNHKSRLLKKLKDFDGNLIINISPPIKDASSIITEHGTLVWRNFVEKLLNEFKEIKFMVEIGSTVNRQSWTRISYQGFYKLWSVAFNVCRIKNRKIIGPNVTDFEPFVNFGILKSLQSKHQLPDLLSNNMFAERTIQPEPYDPRVFIRKFPQCFKFDLYKKSAVYKFLAQEFKIKGIISPCSFWSIKRIGRLKDQPEQQRAKYVTRYFAMMAAKGNFEKVFWGALICHREGLIHNGLNEPEYPNIEQVTFYREAKGYVSNYHITQSFRALQFFNQTVPGSTFIKSYSDNPTIQILEFETDNEIFHIIWTQNNCIADIQKFYHINQLRTVTSKDKYGNNINQPTSINDDPMYLFWPKESRPHLIQKPFVYPNAFVEQSKENFYFLHDENWSGITQAKDIETYKLILKYCHPDTLLPPDKDQSLRKSRNAVWIKDIPNFGKVVIKKPMSIYRHKRFLDRNRPNKSLRAWNGTHILLSKGINAAKPIAVFNKKHDPSSLENYYISLYKEGYSFNDLALHFKNDAIFKGFTMRQIFEQCAEFINKMHSRGVFFNDLSAGNILMLIENNNFHFELIDTGRVKNFNSSLNYKTRKTQRMKDLVRLLNKFDWEIRNIFLKHYFALNNKKPSFFTKLQLVKYDVFVNSKRLRKKILKKLS
ncbi:MAG: lipopolysaccharide kinase InaA family protein [Methylophilaceae bacterium]